MRKKLFSILLSLAMVVTMMPAMALTAFATEDYNITVPTVFEGWYAGYYTNGITYAASKYGVDNFYSSDGLGQAGWTNTQATTLISATNWQNDISPYSGQVSNTGIVSSTVGITNYLNSPIIAVFLCENVQMTVGTKWAILLKDASYTTKPTYTTDDIYMSGIFGQAGTDIDVVSDGDTSKWALLTVAMAGEGSYLSEQTITDEADTPTNLFKAKDEEGVRTITLLDDITATSSDSEMMVEATGDGGKEIIFDLNGHTLNANGTYTNPRRVFEVEGSLTIMDSSDTSRNGTGGGKIINGCESANGGAIVIESSGELIIESGAICNNKTSSFTMNGSGGGAVHCKGKLTINGGAIYNNKACWGGAIGLNNGAEFLMTGGKIYGNQSLVMDGAAINMFKNTGDITSTIIGGEIYGNTSNRMTNDVSNDATVGGVAAAGNAVWAEGTLYIGGNAKIHDNKQGDYIESTKTWANLTNNANLAMVSDSDSGKRGDIKISTEYPLNSGANICLSQTSEHVRVVPLEENNDLTGFGITTANGFTAENCRYLHVDGLNNSAGYDIINKEGTFYTKAKSEPTPLPIWIDPKTPDEKTTEIVEESKIVPKTIVAYKSGKIKVTFKALTLSDGTKVTKYQVRRAVNKKFTKKLKKYNATCKASSKTVSFTNAKGLKKGTRYYYKIRGKVQLSDGSWVYTKWSKVKSVKCKKTRK